MSNNPTIYLAGPMTGKPDFNHAEFNAAASRIRKSGHGVCNPAEIDGGSTDKEWSFYMRDAISMLVGCDEVWVLDGWEESKGACIEVRIASILGMPVRNQHGHLLNHSLVECTLLNASEFICGGTVPIKKSEETICQEADRLVSCDRQDTYGHPFHDFSRTGQIWAAILGLHEITPEQVAMCMVGLKISRECNKHKRDNLVDGAGYFKCLDMVHEFRKNHELKP